MAEDHASQLVNYIYLCCSNGMLNWRNILLSNRLFSARIFALKHQSMPCCSPASLSFRSSGLPVISATPIRTSSEHQLSPTKDKNNNKIRHSKSITQLSFSYCTFLALSFCASKNYIFYSASTFIVFADYYI